MTYLPRLMAALLVFFTSLNAAFAEQRIALIVGIGGYTSVAPLDNPVPDADLMAQVLRDKGFEVTILTDPDQDTLNRGISQFGRDLRGAGKDATGLFFYAGHAVQSFGENYLLPVDTTLTDAADLSLVAVQAQAVLRQMASARNKTNIVILDACRNNPFQEIPDMTDNGLAEMNAPTGTFLSYSTAPGSVALDGLDGNSPFTKALADEILSPGIPIEQTFKKVRIEVIAQTQGKQTPWDTSSLTGEFFFQPVVRLTAQEIQEKQLWDSIKNSADPVQVMLFLRSYPAGLYQEPARELLTNLMTKELGTGSVLAGDRSSTEFAALEPAAKPEESVRTAQPTKSEDTLIAAAQSTGAAVDYQAYIDAFPQGTYAELAAFELKIIKEKAEREAAAQAPKPAAPNEVIQIPQPAETAASADFSTLTFTSPFPTGGAPIEGFTIEEIVGLSPLFTPIDGIPEELWKDQTCSNCHEWTKNALCDQGKTYVTAADDVSISKKHPFGGIFKQGLRAWASADCP